MQARDIFSARFLDGNDQELHQLLEYVPLELASELLGSTITDIQQIKPICGALSRNQHDALWGHVDLVIEAGGMDREELEPIARNHGVGFGNTETTFAIVHSIIRKLGIEEAQKKLIEALRPLQAAPTGKFAEFEAPSFDAGNYKSIEFAKLLEAAIEQEISAGSIKQRLAKVRTKLMDNDRSVVVAVYFERPNVTGSAVLPPKAGRTGKTVELRTFDRPSGTTYFVIKGRGPSRKSRVMFRNPEAKLTRSIRSILGSVMWSNSSAVATKAAVSFDLSVFLDPEFKPEVSQKHRNDVDSILLSSIQLLTAHDNLLTLKAPGRRGDAIADLRRISRASRVFAQGAAVESVELKFLPKDDERSLFATAKVTATDVAVNVAHYAMLIQHLKEWGAVRD